MSYDGNDLGYDLGYELETHTRRVTPQRNLSSYPEQNSISYSMDPPGSSPAAGGARQPSAPLGGVDLSKLVLTDDKGQYIMRGGNKVYLSPEDATAVLTGKKKPEDVQGASEPAPKPKAAKTGGDKVGGATPNKTPQGAHLGVTRQPKAGQTWAVDTTTQFSDHENDTKTLLLQKGMNEQDIRTYLNFHPVPKGSTAAVKKYNDDLAKKLEGQKPEEVRALLHKENQEVNAQKWADYYRDQKVSPEVAKANMVERGIVSKDTEFPEKNWPPKNRPALDPAKVKYPENQDSKSLRRSQSELEGMPQFPRGTLYAERDAAIRQDTERVNMRNEYIRQGIAQGKFKDFDEGSRQFYKIVGSQDFSTTEWGPKLFKMGDGSSPLYTFGEGNGYISGHTFLKGDVQAQFAQDSVQVGEQTVTAETYAGWTSEQRAEFAKTHPLEAAGFDTKVRAGAEQRIMAMGTDAPPYGFGYSEAKWKAILASDAYGSPPVFDADGKVRSDAEPRHIEDLEKQLKTDRQSLFGRTYEFDSEGNPVQGTDGDGNPQVGPNGEPVAKRRPGVNDDDVLDLNEDVNFHMAEKEQKARDYYRERIVTRLDQMGLDSKNIGAYMNGNEFYGDDPDLPKMAQEAKRLDGVTDKKQIIGEINDNGWSAPKAGDKAALHEEISYYVDSKKQQGGRPGARGGASGVGTDQKWAARYNARTQKEAATIANRRAIGLKRMDQENWYKQQDYAEEKKIAAEERANVENDRREGLRFGHGLAQAAFQSSLNLAGQFAQKPLDSAFRRAEAMFEATARMIARMAPNPWDFISAMLGGGGRGRRG